MKSGMIRKLDEVGRIVIPKEIRKYLSLKEGSPLEIGINDTGEVVLRANMIDNSLLTVSQKVCDILHQMLDMQMLFVIDGEVIYSNEKISNSKISASILKIMEDNITYFACEEDRTTLIPVLQDSDITYKGIIVVPFATETKCSIIAVSDNARIEMYEVKLLELVVRLITELV